MYVEYMYSTLNVLQSLVCTMLSCEEHWGELLPARQHGISVVSTDASAHHGEGHNEIHQLAHHDVVIVYRAICPVQEPRRRGAGQTLPNVW